MPVLLGGPDINDSENLPGFYHSGGKVKKSCSCLRWAQSLLCFHTIN